MRPLADGDGGGSGGGGARLGISYVKAPGTLQFSILIVPGAGTVCYALCAGLSLPMIKPVKEPFSRAAQRNN